MLGPGRVTRLILADALAHLGDGTLFQMFAFHGSSL